MTQWLFELVPARELIFFRLILASSLLLKFFVEWQRGYWNYTKPQSYLWYSDWSQHKRFSWAMRAYRLCFFPRFVAAIALFAGVAKPIAGLILITSLAAELRLFFKYHANLMLLFVTLFIVCPKSIWAYGINGSSATTIERIYYVMFGATVVSCYIFTAFHKMNSRFLSGAVITKTLHQLRLHKRLHFDNTLARFSDKLIRSPKFISMLMILTLALELIIPPLLFSKSGFLIACILGAMMHVGFTILFPATLMHFSILMVGSYVLFANLGAWF